MKHITNNQMLKDVHFGMRLTTAEAELIDKGAVIDRRPRSQFVVKAAIEKAKQIVGGVQNE